MAEQKAGEGTATPSGRLLRRAAVLAAAALVACLTAAAMATPSAPPPSPPDGGVVGPLFGVCTPGDTQPCTLTNGCPGENPCVGGHWSACRCSLDGQPTNIACSGCGATGTATCSATCALGACQKQCNPNNCSGGGTQTCNPSTGQWSSCNGCSGTTPCTTTCSSAGARTCAADCSIGTCSGPEVCNNCDDDLNGVVDDGLSCEPCAL